MSRRGRTLIVSAVFVLCLLGLMGARSSESLSSSYKSFSSSYHLPSWRPHFPGLPFMVSSPLKPSNLTLELESGERQKVPSHLTKTTPNFHLLMPALSENIDFCKTTLSAMLLNYPPPTMVNFFQTFQSEEEREKAKLQGILGYLKDGKLVNDEDLVLIVDGYDVWFQLPSEVMIRQYQTLLSDANKRLMEKYGVLRSESVQRFNQTIVFGAEKGCVADDLACRYAPESMLPDNIYGSDSGKEKALTPAKHLNAGTIMGPAKDLRALFKAAVTKFEEGASYAKTSQSVMATIFGEQQLARDTERKSSKTAGSKWLNWLDVQLGKSTSDSTANGTLQEGQQYEFSVGLDYTHTLFQPFTDAAKDELAALPHDNSTDLSKYHHPNTPTPPLSIPSALEGATPPFYTLDPSHGPSPNEKPAFIEPLAHQKDLDELPPAARSWANLKLIQNTYTGAIPALLHLNIPLPLVSRRLKKHKRRIPDVKEHQAPRADLKWENLWYAGYERALLRKYLRQPQSPTGFHAAAVGGDRLWDQRGGRGGIWTAKEQLWMPWGEVDGVCGTVDQIHEIFGDGKGVWLHEHEQDAEQERRKQEKEFRKKTEEKKKKNEEQRQKEEVERKKVELEEAKQKEEAREGMEQEAARRMKVYSEIVGNKAPER
ncbi:hypothetical protein K469DRAFT_712651 [Zopfia rhizophila CBS 207.26]|uniref:Uncharacterized protein n=1 Tax=Zopfia rhizophila CBS 207.26 TaxID=1314779 RepID=A0A6A6ESW8_9PEZI|nr:hypothetical protein K469DRAFT_712651 [Zopfia rhizophila CBS 207.26]